MHCLSPACALLFLLLHCCCCTAACTFHHASLLHFHAFFIITLTPLYCLSLLLFLWDGFLPAALHCVPHSRQHSPHSPPLFFLHIICARLIYSPLGLHGPSLLLSFTAYTPFPTFLARVFYFYTAHCTFISFTHTVGSLILFLLRYMVCTLLYFI